MKPVESEKKDKDSESKILQAARKIFAKRGFGTARIDEIANEAGVNKAMIYYHFKSKDDLYAAVIDSFFGKRNEIFDGDDSKAGSSWERLTKAISIFIENVQTYSEEKTCIISREMASRGPIFQLMRDKYWVPTYEKFRALIHEGIKNGEFRTSESEDFITFTIFSHITFYNINEVTYRDSVIHSALYPLDYRKKMEAYLLGLLRKILCVKD
ncbi:MAG: TetR/AcrR family transcriptional regulator [Leptospira sp.]|nr:TetR/AcrR family transcriptional regulator [Leptospira sp.]